MHIPVSVLDLQRTICCRPGDGGGHGHGMDRLGAGDGTHAGPREQDNGDSIARRPIDTIAGYVSHSFFRVQPLLRVTGVAYVRPSVLADLGMGFVFDLPLLPCSLQSLNLQLQYARTVHAYVDRLIHLLPFPARSIQVERTASVPNQLLI
jgi:hypothetical protein